MECRKVRKGLPDGESGGENEETVADAGVFAKIVHLEETGSLWSWMEDDGRRKKKLTPL